MTTRSATRRDWFDEPAPPPAPPQPPRRRRRPMLLAAGGALLALVALALVIAGTYGDKILPGTSVAGVDLGGADAADARRRLAPVLDSGRPVTLTAGSTTITVDPADAGYSVDLDATIQRAMDAGRGGPLGTVRGVVSALAGGREVAPVLTVDRARLRAAVRDVASQVDRPVGTGAITASPETLAVEITAPRDGRRVRRAALAARLQDAFSAPRRAALAIPVSERPAVSLAKVRAVAERAETYLARPLVVQAPGGAITVTQAQLATLVQLHSLDGGRDARLATDPAARATLVEELAARRDRPARDVQFSAGASSVVVDGKGEVSWRPRAARVTIREPGRAGRSVDRAATGDRIDRAIRAGSHTITLPVKTVKTSVTAEQARGIDRMIGTFTSYYTPAPRVTNIRTIAAAVDGTVIAPGSTFSLNDVAGERTEEKGYVKAPFIAEGNRLEDSVGGGVSQFSTTLYNAAYFAGLRLDAHTAHSFYIDRYPAGRESTLNFGSIDLRWTNDTKTPVLVRTSSTDTSVTVRLYGDNGERRVQALPGTRSPTADGGFSIKVTRVIRTPDGKVIRQPVTTTYGVPAED